MSPIDKKLAGLFVSEAEVPAEHRQPYIADGDRSLIGGEIRRGGARVEVESPICLTGQGEPARYRLGAYAAQPTQVAEEALAAAERAWDSGRGPWPTASVAARLERLELF